MKVPRRAPAGRGTGRDRARPVAERAAPRPGTRGARGRLPELEPPPPVQPPGSGPRSYFTRRAAVFAAVVFLVAMSVAYPAQRYMAQRADLESLRAQVSAGEQRVADLEQAVAEAEQSYAIERQARLRLHYVQPGEEVYRVIDPLVVEQSAAEQARAAGPWWDRMLGSVAEASTPVEALPVDQPAS